MEKSKVQLIIGALLLLSFPLVCWLDNPNSTPIMPHKENDEVEKETEFEKTQRERQAKQDQEREEEKRKEEERKAQWAKDKKRMEAARVLTEFLQPEWSISTEVNDNGNFKLSKEKNDGVWVSYTFNITGITFEKKATVIFINGAIQGEREDSTWNASNVIISRNPVVFDLLQKFQTTIMEDLVK